MTPLQQGRESFEKAKYDEAILHFTTALVKKLFPALCRYYLGRCWFEKQEFQKALVHLGEAEKLASQQPVPNDDPADLYYQFARCFDRLGKHAETREYADKGIAINPHKSVLHTMRGNGFYGLKQYLESIECYRKAIELDPLAKFWPDIVRNNLCNSYLALNKQKEALAAIEDAIKILPNAAQYHNRRGLILADGLQDYVQALTAFKKAVEFDPECSQVSSDGSYYFNIAFYLNKTRKFQEALPFAEKALTFRPTHDPYKNLKNELVTQVASAPPPPTTPILNFSKVGGMKSLKEEIRTVMNVLLVQREKALKYRIEKNGILLYGPPGCGKTFFAEAIAGEFQMKFISIPLGSVVSKWVGESAKNLEAIFNDAKQSTPCFLFFDEFNAFIPKRDSGRGTLEDSRLVDTFLQQIDAARKVPGLILGAATNFLESLDPAAIREGRFDYKIKIYKPDFEARLEIFKKRLLDCPVSPEINYFDLANRTENFSTAKIVQVVNNAALFALELDQPIDPNHLQKALDKEIGKDKYEGKKKTWDDLILDPTTKEKLQFIEKIIENPEPAKELGLSPPSGLLLYGPPGTGKTTVARVLASEVSASFYVVTPADVYSKWVGESEQQVKQIFEKARENRPSIIFLDEIDALLSSRDNWTGNAYKNTIVNLFLMEMDGLSSSPGVFIIGATNRPDMLDEALLRPGRLSEHIEIPLPFGDQRLLMLKLFSKKMPLDPKVNLQTIAEITEEYSGADLEGLCNLAARNALLRIIDQKVKPLIEPRDFEKAITERTKAKGTTPQKSKIGFNTADSEHAS